MHKIFLEAQWRKLAMVNYSVDEKLLYKYLPKRTEIDVRNDVCYVSLVGFMFLETRVRGVRIPCHVNFEEVNLRFYVRYKDKEWKRGVVFIKEIVPRPALTFVANTIYKENYETMPMRHSWAAGKDELNVDYQWRKNRWNSISVTTDNEARPIAIGSEEEFITEHYWGYTRISDERTSEYKVEHPKWDVYKTRNYLIDVDFHDVYGPDFAFLTTAKPVSVFLAEGSEIQVKHGKQI